MCHSGHLRKSRKTGDYASQTLYLDIKFISLYVNPTVSCICFQFIAVVRKHYIPEGGSIKDNYKRQLCINFEDLELKTFKFMAKN